jgi:hypothetical protein
MKRSPIAVESVSNLPADDKRLLEGMLGQELEKDQQIFIMVFSPGTEPDEAARSRARAGMEETFRRTEAYARAHQVSDEQVDAAIEEAMREVRSGQA